MSELTETTYSTRLEQILKEEGRTQVWLARQTGIYPSRINSYVKGHLHPEVSNQTKISKALEREIKDVFAPLSCVMSTTQDTNAS